MQWVHPTIAIDAFRRKPLWFAPSNGKIQMWGTGNPNGKRFAWENGKTTFISLVHSMKDDNFMRTSFHRSIAFKSTCVLALAWMGFGIGPWFQLQATPLPTGLQSQLPDLENCQVHQKSLVYGFGWAVAGLIVLPKKYQKAWAKKFPNSELTAYTGCEGSSDYPAIVKFCIDCRQAEIRWLKKYKKHQKDIQLPRDLWWVTF